MDISLISISSTLGIVAGAHCSTEEAKDEEMVLDKAEPDIHIEDAAAAPDSPALGQYPMQQYARSSFSVSRITLHDIEPAPELRINRYDTAQSSVADLSLASTEYPRSAVFNTSRMALLSTTSLNATLEEEEFGDDLAEVAPVSLSSRRGSQASSSFFAAPVYATRSRSRSIETYNSAYVNETERRAGPSPLTTSAATSIAPPASATSSNNHLQPHAPRRSSGLRLPFFSRSQSINSLLPVHNESPSDTARVEALRSRDISAPLTETLVRTSYQLPKAGLSTLQAAWLGSRDAINRLTTFTETTPPAFADAAEPATMTDEGNPVQEDSDQASARPANTAAGGVDDHHSNARVDNQDQRRSTTMTQLEEESARFSSLVARESLRRLSIPAHLVALPPSLPSSPVDGSIPPIAWPSMSRSESVRLRPSGALGPMLLRSQSSAVRPSPSVLPAEANVRRSMPRALSMPIQPDIRELAEIPAKANQEPTED